MILLANPLVKVNSLTIRVPSHAGSEYSGTTKSSKINASTKCKVNGNPWIIDGDSGTWTCPICGSVQKFSVNGNSKIKIDNKNACQTGVTFNIGHNGSIISQDLEYDSTVNIN